MTYTENLAATERVRNLAAEALRESRVGDELGMTGEQAKRVVDLLFIHRRDLAQRLADTPPRRVRFYWFNRSRSLGGFDAFGNTVSTLRTPVGTLAVIGNRRVRTCSEVP